MTSDSTPSRFGPHTNRHVRGTQFADRDKPHAQKQQKQIIKEPASLI